MKKDISIKMWGFAAILVFTSVILALSFPSSSQKNMVTDDALAPSQDKTSEEVVNVTKDWEFNDHSATEWKTYTNEEYGITLQYPSHYVYDESKLEPEEIFKGVSISFGPPYETVFKKEHENAKAAHSFAILIREIGDSSLEKIMEDGEKARGAEMKSTENLELTRKIAGYPAKQVRFCYPNPEHNPCGMIYYFNDNKYVYQITDQPLAGKVMDRENLEKMISSLRLK